MGVAGDVTHWRSAGLVCIKALELTSNIAKNNIISSEAWFMSVILAVTLLLLHKWDEDG